MISVEDAGYFAAIFGELIMIRPYLIAVVLYSSRFMALVEALEPL